MRIIHPISIILIATALAGCGENNVSNNNNNQQNPQPTPPNPNPTGTVNPADGASVEASSEVYEGTEATSDLPIMPGDRTIEHSGIKNGNVDISQRAKPGNPIGNSTRFMEADITRAPAGFSGEAVSFVGDTNVFGSTPLGFPHGHGFGVLTDGTNVQSHAILFSPYNLSASPLPSNGAQLKISNIEYSYMDGTTAGASTPVHGTDGEVTIDENGDFKGWLGSVKVDGNISGTDISGTTELQGTNGALEGIAGERGGNNLGHGVFAGNDNNYAYAGGFVWD